MAFETTVASWVNALVARFCLAKAQLRARLYLCVDLAADSDAHACVEQLNAKTTAAPALFLAVTKKVRVE